MPQGRFDDFNANAMAQSDAEAAVASVQDVSPQDAVTGMKGSGPMGVPPIVAARVPATAQSTAQSAARTQTFAQHPDVASWAGSTDPAHVAAAKDQLPALGKVDYAAEAWKGYSGPLGSLAEAFNNASAELKAAAEAGPVFESSPGENLKQFIKSGKAILDTLGAVWAPALDFGGRTLASLPLPMYDHNNPFSGPELNTQQRIQQGANVLGLALTVGAIRAGTKGPTIDEGNVTPQSPPRIPGTGPDIQDAEFEPIQPSAQPGAHAPTDQFRAQVAELDAKGIEGLQEAVAENPTTAQSPTTMQDFLEHKFPDQIVEMDPERVSELMAQGHDLSAFDPGEIARASQSGDMMRVPLSQYLIATSGQPWAADLNSATNFREGGQSLDDAKETPDASMAAEGAGSPTQQEGGTGSVVEAGAAPRAPSAGPIHSNMTYQEIYDSIQIPEGAGCE